jgi:CRISPR-associated endonuclease/helicase Cas3
MPETGASPLIANASKQLLAEHCALVGLLAEKIINETYVDATRWGETARVAGFLHDIGKLDPTFQGFLRKGECTGEEDSPDGVHIAEPRNATRFSFNEYPRHNEVSWALLSLYVDRRRIDKELLRGVEYAVFWHHAKPLRLVDDAFSTQRQILAPFKDKDWSPLLASEQLMQLIVQIYEAAGECLTAEWLGDSPIEADMSTPTFKGEYAELTVSLLDESVKREAYLSAVRSAVVSADRIVSGLSASELSGWLEVFRSSGELPAYSRADKGMDIQKAQIFAKLDEFASNPQGAQRNEEQSQAACALNRLPVSVLQGPAGCGKTKIMLEFLTKQTAARTYIFVPRTAIGAGLFEELVTEYGVRSNIELLLGSSKLITDENGRVGPTAPSQELTGQIIVTTIDQLCSIALGHRRIDLLTEVMSSTVVVDEFHEIFDVAGISLMFFELLYLKSRAKEGKTLLISATPNPFFLKTLSALTSSSRRPDLINCVVPVKSFNDKPFSLKFESFANDEEHRHPFEDITTIGEIAVANTAKRAQRSALAALYKELPVICAHSKYTPRDKKSVFEQVMRAFSRNSGSNEYLLFSGPIVQASLNISCRVLHTEACPSENWLQRLGRVNRFASFDRGMLIVYDTIEKGVPGNADKVLRRLGYQWNRTQAWIDYCRGRKMDLREWTLNELYDEYSAFHRAPETNAKYLDDFSKSVEASAKLFKQKDFDPIQYPAPAGSATKKSKKLSKNSLRGDSFFVLPVKQTVSKGQLIDTRWLYQSSCPDDCLLTDSLQVLAHDESNTAALMAYMKGGSASIEQYRTQLPNELKKLFQPKGRKVKKFSTWKQWARSRDTPIILSMPGAGTKMDFEQSYFVVEGTLIGLLENKRVCFTQKQK